MSFSCDNPINQPSGTGQASHRILPLASLHSAVFLINSCSHLVSATPVSLESKSHHQQERTFSRSYGTILPSSFSRVLSSALVFSTRPPVSVWGTIPTNLKLRRFSWKHGINYFSPLGPRHQLSVCTLKCDSPDLPKKSTYHLKRGLPTPR